MIKALDRLLRVLLTAAMVLIFAEVLVEVASRFIFHNPLPWGAEFSQTLLVWVTFLGAAAAFPRGGHIGVDMFADMLPARARAVLKHFNLLLILAFLVCGMWSGYKVVVRVWGSVTASLQISAAVLYLALPVGFAMTFIFALRMFFTSTRELRGAENKSEKEEAAP